MAAAATMAASEEVEKEVVPPIFAAAAGGDVDEVETALKDPSAASVLNAAGRSALSLAAAKGHLKVVKLLLDAGASDSAASHTSRNAQNSCALRVHDDAFIAAPRPRGAPP